MSVSEKAVKSAPVSNELLFSDIIIRSQYQKKFLRTYDVIIVGGGPSGAYLGYCLARQGLQAVILDDSHPREKPCGGVIQTRAFKKFPLIQAAPYTSEHKSPFEIIAPSGQKVVFDRNRGNSVSRRSFDRYLLDSAIRWGCKFIAEKALSISSDDGLWMIKTQNQVLRTRILVGADGVRSIVRKTVLSPFENKDLAIGIGYLATENNDLTTQMKFFTGQTGYAWKVNRGMHCNIGVIESLDKASHIKNELGSYMQSFCKDVHPFTRWSALVPRASSGSFFENPCAGKNWILIGDAAGHVHPLTSEGIMYALWSAELASQAISSGDPRLFDTLWRDEYGEELFRAASAQKLFYKKSTQNTTVWLSGRSKTMAAILFDLLNGNASIDKAWWRTLSSIPAIGAEAIVKDFRASFS